MTHDIRWIQRLNSWNRALAQLTRFMQAADLDELQQQGLIQAFEYNHELAWKVQKDFLQDRGYAGLYGSKDVARQAFAIELVLDGEVWLDMIQSRNLSSHTYNQTTTDQILAAIRTDYYPAFCALNEKLNGLAQQDVQYGSGE